jgi:hypothetical protein
VVRCEIVDTNFNRLKNLMDTYYLRKARQEYTVMEFEIRWERGGDKTPPKDSKSQADSTGYHIAYITNIDATGFHTAGRLEFIAIDIPTYWLNAGDSSGKAYRGNIKDVMESVVNEYFITPNKKGEVVITDTNDSKQNVWYMMRQDPRTFINSMLEWSSPLTDDKTSWIVTSRCEKDKPPSLWIRKQADKPNKNFGAYVVNTNAPSGHDIIKDFQFVSDNYMSLYQKNIITQGLSATTGAYYDRIFDKKRRIVHVHDENTAAKLNTKIDEKTGFKKPNKSISPLAPHDWSTDIGAIPQHNAGDIGIKYSNYIDGRARKYFLNNINMVMRVKLKTIGDPLWLIVDSHNLGSSKLKIIWQGDDENDQYFMGKEWIVYGFHHEAIQAKMFTTYLYCYRLDYDADSRKI